MRCASARRSIAVVTMAALGLGACGDSYRKDLRNGFPPGLVIMVDGDEPQNLRGALDYYHVPATGIDCMIEAVQAAGRFSVGNGSTTTALGGRPTLTLTGEDLNAYARGCGVDLSALWYMSD